MTSPVIMEAVVDGYRRDRRAEAAKARLLAIAACCRPSAIRRALASARRASHTLLRSRRQEAAPCCP